MSADPVSCWLRLCANARRFATGSLSVLVAFPGLGNNLNVNRVEDSCGSTKVIFTVSEGRSVGEGG